MHELNASQPGSGPHMINGQKKDLITCGDITGQLSRRNYYRKTNIGQVRVPEQNT